MTTSEVGQSRLLDVAHELVAELDSLPAGTVLRCFFRAAHQARRSGVGPSELPQVARRRALATLSSRLSSRVPAPRRPLTRPGTGGAVRAAGRSAG